PIDYVPMLSFCDGRGQFNRTWAATLTPNIEITDLIEKGCRCNDGWASVGIRNETYSYYVIR
ncbi:hypothetical protein Pmar_PMAR016292, partial [Perkinsus marinus ATCC 50983]